MVRPVETSEVGAVVEVVVADVVEVGDRSLPDGEHAASTIAEAISAIPVRLLKMRIVPNMMSAKYQNPGITCKHSISRSLNG
jgi:hypothetical protein